VFIFLAAAFGAISILLGDQHINGFVGTAGIIRLELSGSSYIELTHSPTRVLVRQDEFDAALNAYFDEDYNSWHWAGHATKNGISYYFAASSFTRRYAVVRLYHEYRRT